MLESSDAALASEDKLGKFKLNMIFYWIGAVLSLSLLAGAIGWSYKLVVRDINQIPIVRAQLGPLRVAPDNPGGLTAANQGLSVTQLAVNEKPLLSGEINLAPAAEILNEENLALKVTEEDESKKVDGRIVLRNNFNKLLEKFDNLLIFGEDSGKIGDVNQGLEGLQEIHGKERVGDRGIREASIVGEGIGLSLRGFRPIAEIQYLDYVLYALQILSDDLATLHYRTFGRQIAPLIIRTRGHRLEGIWHSGSPMGALLSTLRGINILVPRNMVQASGMYNTLLRCDEPAILIESLNGYRLKEKEPNNLSDFTVLLGKAEVLRVGEDITVVSYGSTLRLVEKAGIELEKLNINIEIKNELKKIYSDRLSSISKIRESDLSLIHI